MTKKKRGAWIIVATLCVWTGLQGAERVVPEVPRRAVYSETEEIAHAYKQIPAEMKTWRADRPLPTSWVEAGMRADAALYFIRGYFDGGTTLYVFKDSTGRIFPFCLETPLRGGPDRTVVTVKDRQFYLGEHPTARGAVPVPLGSAADAFLITVLARAAELAPPLPPPPRGPSWSEVEKSHLVDARPEISTELDGDFRQLRNVAVLQDVTIEALGKMSPAELRRRMETAPNPLRKGERSVVVIAIQCDKEDDIVRLDGVEADAEFYFSHQTRAQRSNREAPYWRVFYLPMPAVYARSTGVGHTINDSGYVRPKPEPGYRYSLPSSAATGRMFK